MVCSNDTCLVSARNGEACDAMRPCEDPFRCLEGTCHAPSATVGAACGTDTTPSCDWRVGFLCTGPNGTCARYTSVGPGGDCGPPVNGVYRFCHSSAECSEGKCQQPAGTGDACDELHGRFCTYRDVCIASKCANPYEAITCL